MRKGPRATQYALYMYNADEQRINGTGTPGTVDEARALARNVLCMMPDVAYIDIHSYGSDGIVARHALCRVDWDQDWQER